LKKNILVSSSLVSAPLKVLGNISPTKKFLGKSLEIFSIWKYLMGKEEQDLFN
jgi:hypothetical protein